MRYFKRRLYKIREAKESLSDFLTSKKNNLVRWAINRLLPVEAREHLNIVTHVATLYVYQFPTPKKDSAFSLGWVEGYFSK